MLSALNVILYDLGYFYLGIYLHKYIPIKNTHFHKSIIMACLNKIYNKQVNT